MRVWADNPLWRAWGGLMALGALTTLAAALGGQVAAPVLGAAILALAWAKARLILGRYLDLDRAPAWRRGFSGVIGAFLVLLYGIYLIPAV